jgi:hypothetical protein
MDLNFRIIQAKDFLIASPMGKFDLEHAKQSLLSLALENATPRQYDILIDIRGAEFDSLLFTDIADLAQVLIGNRDSFRSKLAILTPLGCEFDKVKFLELYAGNRGFQVGAFVDFEEALYWLVAPHEKPNHRLSESEG